MVRCFCRSFRYFKWYIILFIILAFIHSRLSLGCKIYCSIIPIHARLSPVVSSYPKHTRYIPFFQPIYIYTKVGRTYQYQILSYQYHTCSFTSLYHPACRIISIASTASNQLKLYMFKLYVFINLSPMIMLGISLVPYTVRVRTFIIYMTHIVSTPL